MDCDNVDIYPVGWAELVGHKLESPRPAEPLITKKEKRKSATGGKKGGPKKRTTGNSSVQSNKGTNLSITTAVSVSPTATSQLTPSLSSASLSQQNGSRKSRRVVSPASDTSGVSTRTPTPPTGPGTVTNLTASTSSASSSPSSPSILTPSADFSDNQGLVTTSTTNSTALISSSKQNIPELEVQIDGSKQLSSSMPTSPTRLPIDNLCVEPMSMENDKNEISQEQMQIIPRLVDSAGQAAMPRGKDINLNPSSWKVEEVAQFLQINECASLSDAFQEQVNII